MTTQPHLPEIMETKKIANFLIRNKFSVEKTKQKIDTYYTIRTLIPDLYLNSHPKSQRMQHFINTSYCCPFPKLLDDTDLLLFIKPSRPDFFELTAQCFNIMEYLFYETYVASTVVVYDFANLGLGDLSKVPPSASRKMVTATEKVLSFRLKALYLVNTSTITSVVLGMSKTFLKAKIFERLHVFHDVGELKKVVPVGFLPRDYGGTAPSLEELNDMLKIKFDEYEERFDKLDKLKVDESLRPEKLNNDDLLGFYGNFKKLDVD
ncbi:uncharacterized protein LOC135132851 isoform X2 [Zophobas morio]